MEEHIFNNWLELYLFWQQAGSPEGAMCIDSWAGGKEWNVAYLSKMALSFANLVKKRNVILLLPVTQLTTEQAILQIVKGNTVYVRGNKEASWQTWSDFCRGQCDITPGSMDYLDTLQWKL